MFKFIKFLILGILLCPFFVKSQGDDISIFEMEAYLKNAEAMVEFSQKGPIGVLNGIKGFLQDPTALALNLGITVAMAIFPEGAVTVWAGRAFIGYIAYNLYTDPNIRAGLKDAQKKNKLAGYIGELTGNLIGNWIAQGYLTKVVHAKMNKFNVNLFDEAKLDIQLDLNKHEVGLYKSLNDEKINSIQFIEGERFGDFSKDDFSWANRLEKRLYEDPEFSFANFGKDPRNQNTSSNKFTKSSNSHKASSETSNIQPASNEKKISIPDSIKQQLEERYAIQVEKTKERRLYKAQRDISEPDPEVNGAKHFLKEEKAKKDLIKAPINPKNIALAKETFQKMSKDTILPDIGDAKMLEQMILKNPNNLNVYKEYFPKLIDPEYLAKYPDNPISKTVRLGFAEKSALTTQGAKAELFFEKQILLQNPNLEMVEFGAKIPNRAKVAKAIEEGKNPLNEPSADFMTDMDLKCIEKSTGKPCYIEVKDRFLNNQKISDLNDFVNNEIVPGKEAADWQNGAYVVVFKKDISPELKILLEQKEIRHVVFTENSDPNVLKNIFSSKNSKAKLPEISPTSISEKTTNLEMRDANFVSENQVAVEAKNSESLANLAKKQEFDKAIFSAAMAWSINKNLGDKEDPNEKMVALKEQLEMFIGSKKSEKPETFSATQLYADQLYNKLFPNPIENSYKSLTTRFSQVLKDLNIDTSKEFAEFQMTKFPNGWSNFKQNLFEKNQININVKNFEAQKSQPTQEIKSQEKIENINSNQDKTKIAKPAVVNEKSKIEPTVPKAPIVTQVIIEEGSNDRKSLRQNGNEEASWTAAGGNVQYGNSDWKVGATAGVGGATVYTEIALGAPISAIPVIGIAGVLVGAAYTLFSSKEKTPEYTDENCPYKLNHRQLDWYNQYGSLMGETPSPWDTLTCDDKLYWVRVLKNK